jgi:elongation factor Ts
MVELNCETDFVAKNEEFNDLAKTIAMHIAWAKPTCIAKDDIDIQDWTAEE